MTTMRNPGGGLYFLFLVFLLHDVCECLQDSEHIHFGIITSGCAPTEPCINNTNFRSVHISDINVTTTFHWKHVQGGELYNLVKTVSEMKMVDVDICLLTAKHDFEHTDPIFSAFNLSYGSLQMIQNLKADDNEDKGSYCRGLSQDIRVPCIIPSAFNGKLIPSAINRTDELISVVVITIIRHVQWKNAVVFYESDMEHEMDIIRRDLSNVGIIITTSAMDKYDTGDYHRFIDSVSDWGVPTTIYMAALCKHKCSKFIKAVNGYDTKNPRQRALRHFSQILLFDVSADITQIAPCLENSTLDHLTVIPIPVATADSDISSYKDLEDTILTLMSKSDPAMLSPHKRKDTLTTHILSRINELQANWKCKWLPIQTLMWSTLTGRGLSTVGYVDDSGNIYITGPIFPNLKFGLNGRHFLVSTVEWTPFAIKLADGTFDGLSFDIFNEIAKRYNFTYNVTEPEDGEWGLELDNGSWTGSIGQLHRKEIDFMVSSLTIHSSREEVMDFSTPFYYDATIILMTKLDPSKSKWRRLIDPFQDTVLLCIGVALLLASLLLFIFEKLSPHNRLHGGQNGVKEFRTYQDSLWYMYGTLLTQGGDRLPTSLTGRAMISCWWLFCIVMMATYSGNLIAFLTVAKSKLPFENVGDMVKQKTYKWGVIGGSYWVTIFQHSRLPDFQSVWDGILRFNRTDPNVLSSNPNIHIQKVLDENYAYLGDKTQIEMRMANECTLQTGEEEILPFQYAFGLPNHSPFTKMLSAEIIEIHESGLMNIWKARHWPKNNHCVTALINSAKAITLSDVQSAFYLVGMGVLFALILLVVERLVFCWKRLYTKK